MTTREIERLKSIYILTLVEVPLADWTKWRLVNASKYWFNYQ